MGSLRLADVQEQLALSLFTDFENMTDLVPGPHHAATAATMFDQLEGWAAALRGLHQSR